jgi:Ala-tRNA(Pro) deacylase
MAVSITKITDFTGFKPEHRALFDLFDRLGIAHETWEHPAIFTVDEGITLNLPGRIPGIHGKNLFLTTKSGDELWLVVACEETRVDLKALSDRLGTKRFSFAKPEVMLEVLGVTPGSATPFALMNDHARVVKVVVEDAFQNGTYCVFHPLVNTHSTVVAFQDLLSFIRHFGYEPRIEPLA